MVPNSKSSEPAIPKNKAEPTKYSGLLFDIDHGSLEYTFSEESKYATFPLNILICTNLAKAIKILEDYDVISLVIFCNSYSKVCETIIEAFQTKIASIPHFQVIVCNELEPFDLANFHEWGIETFINYENWTLELSEILRKNLDLYLKEGSIEFIHVKANKAIQTANHVEMIRAEKLFAKTAHYNYISAYTRGIILASLGLYSQAIRAFEQANRLNEYFRPSIINLCLYLTVKGNYNEALQILRDSEKKNKKNIYSLLLLVICYCEKKAFDLVELTLKKMELIDQMSNYYIEATIYLLLCQKKLKLAFQMINQLEAMGPLLAIKFNNIGVQLSQSGRSKSALILYKKIHLIVNQNMKYKISLNAALACKRTGQYPLALSYLDRCQKEYGKTFPKLEKIRSMLSKTSENQTNKSNGDKEKQ